MNLYNNKNPQDFQAFSRAEYKAKSTKKYFIKDFSEDYKGLRSIYFNRNLKKIIKIGDLKKRTIKILDFGGGIGRLKQMLGDKVTTYDIQPHLSEMDDWKKAEFDVVVANQVFYLLKKEQLRKFLEELCEINPKAELIVGISRQGIVNNFLKYVTFDFDAYTDTKIKPKDELKILKEKLTIIKKASNFFMNSIYLMRFSKEGGIL